MSELMTVKEVCEYLRFNKRTIYRHLKRRSIPAIKIGNKWRFPKDAIDEWLHNKMAGVKARILVVDDDAFVLSIFKETLNKKGHVVVLADSCVQGIEYAGEGDFDMVFLDLKMPDMDGAEAFRRIREMAPGLPVTIITGYPDSDMMARALQHGPFRVMAKPFDAEAIIDALNSLLPMIPARGQM